MILLGKKDRTDETSADNESDECMDYMLLYVLLLWLSPSGHHYGSLLFLR